MTAFAPEVLEIDSDLHLRRAQLSDASEQHRILQENRDFLGKFLKLAPGEDVELADVVEERARIDRAMTGNRYLDYWIINQDDIVGNVSMGSREAGVAMLGFWLTEDAQFQGFATRATRRLISHGRHNLGMQTAEFWVEPDNEPSQQLVQRLGAEKRYSAVPPEWFDIWSVDLDDR